MDDSNTEPSKARDRIAQVYLGEWGDEAFQERSRDRIHWFVEQIEQGTVLDIGCSEGILPILLGRKGIDVVGVDINPEAIEYANNLLSQEDPAAAEHVTFICGNILHEDWAERQFDAVTIGEILEHFSQPDTLIEKAVSLLKPGGCLLVTTPFGYLPDPDHRFTFTLTSFVEYFRSHNLTPRSLTVVDSYIRFSAQNTPAQALEWEPILDSLMSITEQSLLDNQRKFWIQLDDMAKQRTELHRSIREYRQRVAENKNIQTAYQELETNHKGLKTAYQNLGQAHKELVQSNQKLMRTITHLESQNQGLLKQNQRLEALNSAITGGLSYQLSQEVSTALKPVRLTTLLLPLNLAKLIWRRYKRSG